MITGGNATVMVRDFDRAVRFYTEILGLELKFRAGDEWAEVTAGPGLTIGLHSWAPGNGPEPGKAGSVSIGFDARPFDRMIESLRAQGVAFQGPILDNENVRLAFFTDPDGNRLYLCETKPMPAHRR